MASRSRRTIHYVTGSRADFGLMTRCLRALDDHPGFDLALVVTGQHLLAHYGRTVSDIEAQGFRIAGRIAVELSGRDGGEMGHALADELHGFLDLWQRERPNLVLVLGDRGEMLAAGLAAVHLGIPLAHLHGGERSGTLDDSFRHCLTRLSHVHLVASEDARARLIKMAEPPEQIRVVGAPGLVGIDDNVAEPSLDEDGDLSMLSRGGDAPTVVCVFHPVVQESADGASQMRAVLDLLKRKRCRGLVLAPNSDGGGRAIDAVLADFFDRQGHDRLRRVTHLPRTTYLACLRRVDLLVGNSSSGIIESASLGVACLNLGSRQRGRLRNNNTVDCPDFTPDKLDAAFDEALALKGPFGNVYGDGTTDQRLIDVLGGLRLDPALPGKQIRY